jgi:phosphoribosylglycinamide formyltransferase-1
MDRSGTTSDVRIAILSSDRGGHLQALLEDPVVGQWVALVVADRPDAYAIRHAEWHGVSAVAPVPVRATSTYTTSLWCECWRSIRSTTSSSPAWIVGTETVHAYPDRIMKVHHSLLPEFPGPDPLADVLEHGVKQTGVTVHLISRELEVGPIVSQQALEIHDGETWHSLVERIHQLELQMLPAAVRTLVEGRQS